VPRLQVDGVPVRADLRVCAGFWSRLRGYGLGPRAGAGGAAVGGVPAVWLDACAAVHTLWLCEAIDVVFVARDGRVLRVCSRLRPRRFRWCRGARAVLELPSGYGRAFGISRGARLSITHGQ